MVDRINASPTNWGSPRNYTRATRMNALMRGLKECNFMAVHVFGGISDFNTMRACWDTEWGNYFDLDRETKPGMSDESSAWQPIFKSPSEPWTADIDTCEAYNEYWSQNALQFPWVSAARHIVIPSTWLRVAPGNQRLVLWALKNLDRAPSLYTFFVAPQLYHFEAAVRDWDCIVYYAKHLLSFLVMCEYHLGAALSEKHSRFLLGRVARVRDAFIAHWLRVEAARDWEVDRTKAYLEGYCSQSLLIRFANLGSYQGTIPVEELYLLHGKWRNPLFPDPPWDTDAVLLSDQEKRDWICHLYLQRRRGW